jgi:protein-S-isoprenylcysteine O-methyltransferase Ste14
MTGPWVVLLAVLIYGAVHSTLASLWAKGRARRWFGALADRTYRLLYNIFAVLSFLPVLALVGLLPDRTLYAIPMPWVLITSLGQLTAVAVLMLGLFQTDVWSFLGFRQLVQPAASDQPARLQLKGLYRWVRHPLYTAGLVFIWLTPVMTANLLAMNAGLTVYIIVGALFEERKLQREFGQAYADYRKRTPMLIPGLLGKRTIEL